MYLGPQGVLRNKMRLICRAIPATWHPKHEPDIGCLPRARLTYKGKCLHKSCQNGLSFGKDHCHERELIANHREPVRPFMRLTARAPRLAKKQIVTRFGKLKSSEQHQTHCPCGRRRQHSITIVRVNAAPFFKLASVRRGLHRGAKLFKRLQQDCDKDGVAVRKSADAHGYSCRKESRISNDYQKCSFKDILIGAHSAAANKFFDLGDTVMERLEGWPMGGSLSEPATLVDLVHDIHKSASSSKQQKVGWAPWTNTSTACRWNSPGGRCFGGFACFLLQMFSEGHWQIVATRCWH